ncbi:hypothetical protein C1752_01449 [Acaryochloris thomasi RCC1774]|uniref:Asparagine synthetase domain-containing protein n=1 Tax=Acaryochloris thomasi RCC1774 TaxID=1764569 RepID=A0A2W1JL95_9CYAN|nr:hypothetical protein [Acaryochloris thomasi]PZD74129.1 hypothetical protein C1752_01449 [Acaryochloris thomasi RCC1774]
MAAFKHLHRRQFILGPTPVNPNGHWHSVSVSASIDLSHCPELRVGNAQDLDGTRWFLLGLAVETQPHRSAPLVDIAKTTTDKVPELSANWAGRWILLDEKMLYLDASGLLGCFYGQTSEGKTWASSSAALLAEVLSAEVTDPRHLHYETGISWYPPPRSQFLGIQRLLPSQALRLETGNPIPRPLMPAIQPERAYEQGLELIQQSLVTTLKRLSTQNQPLWLGLTAGYDSRLMMALCRVAQIEVKLYTRVAARMSIADQRLPPLLAEVCGYSHTFLRRDQRFPERQALVEAHSGGQISAGDAEPFVRGDRDQLKGLAFGGHGFAIASGFWRLRELPEVMPNPKTGAKLMAQLFQERETSSATAGLQEWLAWIARHPHPHLNWCDRFFIEQRQAGWLSAKEQVYDLTDLVRFPILNCAYLYALLLSIPESQRLNSLIQEALIRRTVPELLDYPFNPEDLSFGPLQILSTKAHSLPQYLLGKAASKTRWLLRAIPLSSQSL